MPVKPHWCQLKSTTTSNGRKGRPKFIFGKTRIFENGTWSAWHDLTTQDVAPDGAAKIGQSFCTLIMSDGASIKYYPRMLPEERRAKVAESCRNCQNYRQYRTGMHNEPRVHVLFNNNEQLGYRYHTVSMQPEPLSSVPIIESLATDLAAYHRLPHNSWNIGCNAVVYSDGTQNIGWHADDTQAEDTVLTYVPEAPDDVSRPVYFRTKRKRGESAKEGDEEYRLFIRSGDGYEMNGLCNFFYEHCLPKTKSKGLRSALVFRSGEAREIQRDSGAPVEGLTSPHQPGQFFGHPLFRRIGDIAVLEGGGLYSRSDLVHSGSHRLDRRGIDGNKKAGVYAIVVSRQDNERGEGDGLCWLNYTCNTGQGAAAMATSYRTRKPVRVFRSSALQSTRSPYAPPSRDKNATSYRYDGLYTVNAIFDDGGKQVQAGPSEKDIEFTFYLERLPSYDESETKNEYCNSLSAARLWEEIRATSPRLEKINVMPNTIAKPSLRTRKQGSPFDQKEEKSVEGKETDSNEDETAWIVKNNVVCLSDDQSPCTCEGQVVPWTTDIGEGSVILSKLEVDIGEEDKLLSIKLLGRGSSKLGQHFQSKRALRVYRTEPYIESWARIFRANGPCLFRTSDLNSPFSHRHPSIRNDGFYAVTEAYDKEGKFVDESAFNSSEEEQYWFIVERLDHATPDLFGCQNLLSARRLWELSKAPKPYDDRDDTDRIFCFSSIPRRSKRQKQENLECSVPRG